MQRQEADVVIFGGGIAGLWLLARLLREGYSALLLEPRGLGGVQTLASQGIIHGGTKYALTGHLTDAAQAIAAMPGRWRAALAGGGELDLRGVRIRADHQFLWSTAGVASRLAGFFAGKAMRSRVTPVAEAQRPQALADPAFRGAVYRLDEPVLDVPSLTAELDRQTGGAALRIAFPDGVRIRAGERPRVALSGEAGVLEIDTHRLVLAAGAGNAALLEHLGRAMPKMQRRPLHMVMVRGTLPALYAHCLGASANPRLTVTSHGEGAAQVWWLGGDLAERGVARSGADQITAARQVLAELLPWLDLADAEWATLRVDRAEAAQPGGRRPDLPTVDEAEGVITVWPTKLAFAPLLADRVIEALQRAGIAPSGGRTPAPDWPAPPLARPPWEICRWN